MTQKIRWGILGAASIALNKVIPGMQKGLYSSIDAIASRSQKKASNAARSLGIPRSYGSYEELLADSQIDAVYIPLPNSLHVPWSIRAAEAGKHVLCEKPLALNAAEAEKLIDARDRYKVKIQEAFMVASYPQWLKAREIVSSGELGEVLVYQCGFSYNNQGEEPGWNFPEYGGGGLLDIGCYPVFTSRFLLGMEPKRVLAAIEFDPDCKVDTLVSALLDYGSVQAQFFCSTKMVPFQYVQILGSRARLEIEIPFNAPVDQACRLFLTQGDIHKRDLITISIEECDQYTIQGDCFSKAILENHPQPIALEYSIQNMKIIDSIFESARKGGWINLTQAI
jgi:predicted dehydrogenase